MEVKCVTCEWVGQQPSPASYDSIEEYEEAYTDYRDSHDDSERNICPTPVIDKS